MAISVQARKAKGRKHQQKVARAILDTFDTLSEDDVRSCSMGSNGADILMSSAAKALVPYEIECKARASGYTSLYDDMDQARTHGSLEPVLIVKQDRRKELVVMTMDHWLELIARQTGPRTA
ncbi:hypothetical protein D3C86_1365240 [compost metagenome]